jgi:hypothetical protein
MIGLRSPGGYRFGSLTGDTISWWKSPTADGKDCGMSPVMRCRRAFVITSSLA